VVFNDFKSASLKIAIESFRKNSVFVRY